MNATIFRLEKKQTVKKDGSMSKTPRYLLTAKSGFYAPLEKIKNQKGEVVLYLNETRGVINSPNNRRAEHFLMGKDSLNFSSIYHYETVNGYLVAFGNPHSAEFFGKEKLPNPFFECRDDGFLFIISPDWQVIEVIVIPNGKYTIISNAKQLADGELKDVVRELRESFENVLLVS
jgi:hypothetical protein